MIGIKAIASYVPNDSIDNVEQAARFGKTEQFVRDKLGPLRLSRVEAGADTSDLAVAAVESLASKSSDRFQLDSVEVLVVVTQNPDNDGLPHTSALVQSKLGLSSDVACFDVGLGCSGYVYGLYVLKGFMEASGFSNGLLVTSDPYSKIIDQEDPNTAMLFGDAATATWLGEDPVWQLGDAKFETKGDGADCLFSRDGRLVMNGRKVFNFAMFEVPKQLHALSDRAGVPIQDLDRILVHQGSAAIVDAIARKLSLSPSVVPKCLENIGNTVSSSIPLAFEREWDDKTLRTIAMSGFGVGLSWASAILYKCDPDSN